MVARRRQLMSFCFGFNCGAQPVYVTCVAPMSWVEGPFRAFWMLASKSDFTTPQLILYANIDDHGVRWGNTGWIITQWQRPVASRVALDLPHWAMRSEPYRLIHMAIEMASKAAAFFYCWLFVVHNRS
jgi:hypothetical protein